MILFQMSSVKKKFIIQAPATASPAKKFDFYVPHERCLSPSAAISTPSPSKKFKFFMPQERCPSPVTPNASKKQLFAPEICLSPTPSTSHGGNKLAMSMVKETILKCDIEELTSVQDIELFLVTQCGLQKAMLLFQGLSHVPTGFPKRLQYVSNILVAGGLEGCFKDLMDTLQHVDKICNVSDFNVPISREVLWKTSQVFKMTHMGFLMTKADSCLEKGCNGKLYGRQKETKQVTVFTLNGPMLFLKANLSCKSCGTR